MSTKNNSIKIEISTKNNYSTSDLPSDRKSINSNIKQRIKDELSDTLKISIERKVNKRKSNSNRNSIQYQNSQIKKESKSTSNEIKERRRTNSQHLSKKETTLLKMDDDEENNNNDKDVKTVKNIRKDYYGNLIKKGKNKKQKVIFRDQIDIGQQKMDLIDVVNIVSYKNWNDNMTEMNKNNQKTSCECKACLIF
jgi:hypothetical protein